MDLSIDAASPVPPFEQLRTRIATQVAEGDLPPGTRLPTVRRLADDLGLAANTVARAYRELEADGVIATEGRRGTFVRSTALAGEDPDESAASYADAARRRGLTLAEATRLLERAWTR